MKDVSLPKHRKPFFLRWWFWLLLIILVGSEYILLRGYDRQAALRQAEVASLRWESKDPESLVPQAWIAALNTETWNAKERKLSLGAVPSLARYGYLIHRLRPISLQVYGCRDENLYALEGATTLQTLELGGAPYLTNLDALKSLKSLQTLSLQSHALQNLSGLKSLPALQTLNLQGCDALQTTDTLRGLASLQTLEISGCEALKSIDDLNGFTSLKTLYLRYNQKLQNIDGIKSLTSLEKLELIGCHALQNIGVLCS